MGLNTYREVVFGFTVDVVLVRHQPLPYATLMRSEIDYLRMETATSTLIQRKDAALTRLSVLRALVAHSRESSLGGAELLSLSLKSLKVATKMEVEKIQRMKLKISRAGGTLVRVAWSC